MGMVTRPALRYHGGKWRIAPWVIAHMPAHMTYVEPFGGAASVLLRKPRSYAEIYNDLDGDVVNLFRVLRNPSQARELVRLVQLTPYSRDEFEASYLKDGDPIEQARRLLVRAWMGFGSRGATGQHTGFRTGMRNSGNTSADNWRDFPAAVPAIVERLRGVVIENRPALTVLQQYDAADTLFYVDPPYVHSTRESKSVKGNPVVYNHELSDDDHVELARHLSGLRGMVMVSGYRCDLYDSLFAGWRRMDKNTHADHGAPRVESLWLSPNVFDRQLKFEVQ